MRKMNIANENVKRNLELVVALLNDIKFEINGETVETLYGAAIVNIQNEVNRILEIKKQLFQDTGKYFNELIDKPQAINIKNKMQCDEWILDDANELIREFKKINNVA